MSQRIILGRLGAVHGVRGWLKVISFTRPPTNILNHPAWSIQHQGKWQTINIEESRLQGNGIIVKFAGIDDREVARTYTNDEIAVDRADMPSLEEDEYYWHDLIGLMVITKEGHTLGKVDTMLETGSNDVFVVLGEKRHLVPYTKDFVIDINLDKKEMIVDWDPEF